MSTLTELKAVLDKAEAAFDKIARRDYVDGRWGYYRAIECDQPVKPDVQQAFDVSHEALRAFYIARDGSMGFLGSKGL
jgi:hypothetical protein